MYMRFKGMLFPAWELHDDRIVFKDKSIYYSDIIHAEFKHCPSAQHNGIINLEIRNKLLGYTLSFSLNENDQAYQAFQYILEKSGLKSKKAPASGGADEERRMKCGVCGKIFCYTAKDMPENKAAGDGREKSTDYTRCPNCNSAKLIDITDIYSESPSAADEIRKLKILLDIGALTREEFELKKKQLLGL